MMVMCEHAQLTPIPLPPPTHTPHQALVPVTGTAVPACASAAPPGNAQHPHLGVGVPATWCGGVSGGGLACG